MKLKCIGPLCIMTVFLIVRVVNSSNDKEHTTMRNIIDTTTNNATSILEVSNTTADTTATTTVISTIATTSMNNTNTSTSKPTISEGISNNGPNNTTPNSLTSSASSTTKVPIWDQNTTTALNSSSVTNTSTVYPTKAGAILANTTTINETQSSTVPPTEMSGTEPFIHSDGDAQGSTVRTIVLLCIMVSVLTPTCIYVYILFKKHNRPIYARMNVANQPLDEEEYSFSNAGEGEHIRLV